MSAPTAADWQHRRQPPAGAMPLGHGPSSEEPMSKGQGSRGKLRFGLGTRGSSRRPVRQNEPEEADDLKDERLEDKVEHQEDIEERSAQSPTTGQAGRAARGRKAEAPKRPQSSRASLRFSPLGSALGELSFPCGWRLMRRGPYKRIDRYDWNSHEMLVMVF